MPALARGRLWYSDFFDRAVFSVSPDGERRVEVEFDGEPGGLGWLPDGRLLFNSRLDRVVMRREPDGTIVRHGDLAPWATWHANDMVVAANGQAYAGNFGFDLDGLYDGTVQGSDIVSASLVRVDPDGTSCEAATDLAFPNGTVITEDGATLIIAESMGGRLTAFDRADDGSLANRREWACPPGVAPDGICLCADGSVWVANACGPSASAWPREARCSSASTTSMNCFACMLGDEDRHTLYLVTAVDSHDNKARPIATGRSRGPDDRSRRRAALTRVAAKVAATAVGTGFLVALFTACALVLAGPAGAAATAAPPFDLAVGGSGSVGFQPTSTHPHGEATGSGYTDDLAAREAARSAGAHPRAHRLSRRHLVTDPDAGWSLFSPTMRGEVREQIRTWACEGAAGPVCRGVPGGAARPGL